MNASGNYKRTFSARDFVADFDPAPPMSGEALKNAMKMLSGNKNA